MGKHVLTAIYALGVGAFLFSIIKGTFSVISLAFGIGYLLCGIALNNKGGEVVRKLALGFSYLYVFFGFSFTGLAIWLWATGESFDAVSLGLGAIVIVVSIFTIRYLRKPVFEKLESESEPT